MRCTRFGILLLVGAVVGLLGLDLAAAGRQGTVVTKDGRKLTGEVVSDDAGGVVVMIGGIRTQVARADVKEVKYATTLQEQYQARRRQLADTDVKGRYELAVWLKDQKLYDLAKKELDDLKQRAPNDELVVSLAALIEERIKLGEPQANPTAEPGQAPGTNTAVKPPVGPGTTPGVGPVRPPVGPGAGKVDLPTKLLSEEQINVVRLYEVDFRARPVVRIPREVHDALFANFQKDLPEQFRTQAGQTVFRNKPGHEQLEMIFTMATGNAAVRGLYPKLKVVQDPPVLQEFRSQIQNNYVRPYCATLECHGGPNAGKLFLFRDRAEREDVAYTNFYILRWFSNRDGAMVERAGDRTEKSLLIQYGLPRKLAATPHPDVPGWRPNLTGAADPKHGLLTNWMKKLYPTTVARYGIDYELPQLPSHLAPESQPAGATAP